MHQQVWQLQEGLPASRKAAVQRHIAHAFMSILARQPHDSNDCILLTGYVNCCSHAHLSLKVRANKYELDFQDIGADQP